MNNRNRRLAMKTEHNIICSLIFIRQQHDKTVAIRQKKKLQTV